MRIITISRQFGSGGRELGKRLADILSWDYYDKEIIQRLADQEGLDKDYVARTLSNHSWSTVPLTYRNTFSRCIPSSNAKAKLLMKQRGIIESIAKTGNDCIIVGRDADIILSDYKPFRVFVCADMEARLRRCMRFEEKKQEGKMSEKDIHRNIQRIDRDRSDTREMLTGKKWEDSTSFNLTVNTANWEIKQLAPLVAELACKWFEQI